MNRDPTSDLQIDVGRPRRPPVLGLGHDHGVGVVKVAVDLGGKLCGAAFLDDPPGGGGDGFAVGGSPAGEVLAVEKRAETVIRRRERQTGQEREQNNSR